MPQLLRAVDVEFGSRCLVNCVLQYRQLSAEAICEPQQTRRVDGDTSPLHVDEYLYKWYLQIVYQGACSCFFQSRIEERIQLDHGLCFGATQRSGLTRCNFRERALRFSLAGQLRDRLQPHIQVFLGNLTERMRSASRVQNEAGQHRVLLYACQLDADTAQEQPIAFDIVPHQKFSAILQQLQQRPHDIRF